MYEGMLLRCKTACLVLAVIIKHTQHTTSYCAMLAQYLSASALPPLPTKTVELVVRSRRVLSTALLRLRLVSAVCRLRQETLSKPKRQRPKKVTTPPPPRPLPPLSVCFHYSWVCAE